MEGKIPNSLLGFQNLPIPEVETPLLPELKNPPIPGLVPRSGLEILPIPTLEISILENPVPRSPFISLPPMWFSADSQLEQRQPPFCGFHNNSLLWGLVWCDFVLFLGSQLLGYHFSPSSNTCIGVSFYLKAYNTPISNPNKTDQFTRLDFRGVHTLVYHGIPIWGEQKCVLWLPRKSFVIKHVHLIIFYQKALFEPWKSKVKGN